MISILIPCYNYNAYNLICRLEKESLTLGIVFEIICIDDASFSNLNEINQKINTLTNCKFFESKKNMKHLVGTVDEVLEHIQVALKVIE